MIINNNRYQNYYLYPRPARATTQAISYIPYGEVFVEQQAGGWFSPYLFNAKELDSETGLYYYGARYLDPSDAMWLSVDPLWEKYVGMTPYQYCMGNPVKLNDPNGMVACDENGNLVIDYNTDNVKALLKSRLNDKNISEAERREYTKFLDGNGQYSSGGVNYTCGIAKTDNGTEFLVATTNTGDSNCSGYAMLGGQAGFVANEAQIVLNEEYYKKDNPAIGDLVCFKFSAISSMELDQEGMYLKQKTDKGNDIPQIDHIAILVNEFNGATNISEYNKNAQIAHKPGWTYEPVCISNNAGGACSLDNVINAASVQRPVMNNKAIHSWNEYYQHNSNKVRPQTPMPKNLK